MTAAMTARNAALKAPDRRPPAPAPTGGGEDSAGEPPPLLFVEDGAGGEVGPDVE